MNTNPANIPLVRTMRFYSKRACPTLPGPVGGNLKFDF